MSSTWDTHSTLGYVMIFSHSVYAYFPAKSTHSLELHKNLQMLTGPLWSERLNRYLDDGRGETSQLLHKLCGRQTAEIQKVSRVMAFGPTVQPLKIFLLT